MILSYDTFQVHNAYPLYVLFNPFKSFSELPPEEQLDDLSSLIYIDSKNIDIDKLGCDVIKEQQSINLHFSSDESALIPEDHAQVMLTSVSIFLSIYLESYL